ncbi:RNI-like protein [Panus rudis PR-1116 ss-1]|nr:RNI-like protein [Panus rudis PR-1116 ss-1]
MSYPSPSSSAVTIPTPGKSILKRPPPPQQSFFARITKLLPTQAAQNGTANDEAKTLKRAHFILPEMTTVYPISAMNPPSTPTFKEEKKSIEEREMERRRRVLRRNSVVSDSSRDEDQWWSMEQVESFYRECCVGREEQPDPAISAAFLRAKNTRPRTVDLSGVQLNVGSASVLSDVFTIEWGLRKLVFKECDLDEHILKPILHALLIPSSLTFLSLASNRRLKAPAFRLVGAYLAKAKSLQFLDLSQNAIDKKSIEYIAASLPAAPTPGLVSLKLDDCQLRPTSLDALAHTVRVSSLRNISLRYNKISASGAVAVALMIKDYPDRFPSTTPPNGSATSSTTSSPTSSMILSPPGTPTVSSSALSSSSTTPDQAHPPVPLPTPPLRSGPILPPPRHPATTPQTTYTPYIPRSKRAQLNAATTLNNTNPLSPSGQPIPIITSSAQGGITARHPVPGTTGVGAASSTSGTGSVPGTPTQGHFDHHHGPSAALLDKVRALDALPRLGALKTLDLRGNDIRGSITYIAQVLKRNRTLKVLNLSENKLDVQGLVHIAEALKYNSCLETLDLSKNPCCGPSLEGVQSLRTAFTLNNALKRLFLSSTNLTSAGAIALAEFLPESTSLLHLDLTMNQLDLAGVMALSHGLKGNHIMRCLDLNIPPGDEEMARMCRDILETCTRNTEEAEKQTTNGESGRGQSKGVWTMIETSELAKTFREDDKKKVDSHTISSSSTPSIASSSANSNSVGSGSGSLHTSSSHAPLVTETDVSNPEQQEDEVVLQAKTCKAQLEAFIARCSSSSTSSASSSTSSPTLEARKVDPELEDKTATTLTSLASLIEATADPHRLEELLNVNDELTALLSRAKNPPALNGLGIRIDTSSSMTNGHAAPSSLASVKEEGSSSDAEEEEEEPVTPRIDKGKGRAEPEPEEPEKVLSPVRVPDSDEEDGEGLLVAGDQPTDLVSPTDRSRSWVAEEGEVFRKGTVLLGPEEMEGEYDGEELRRELLEAMVERPPPRSLNDGFIEDNDPLLAQHTTHHTPLQSPVSPHGQQEPSSPKPPPRPYIRRSRSSSSATVTLDTQNIHSLSDRLLSPGGSSTSSPVSARSPASTPTMSSRSSSRDSR